MNESVIHFHRGGPLVALVGNLNCGKTALFNLLTGSRQKVANYAGVTVERKEGKLITPAGKTLRVLDLPGAYSLHPRSPDERVTCDVLYGRATGEKRPDLVVCVVDATNLRRNLRMVLAVKRLGLPCVVALNMTDLAARRGLNVDAGTLSAELGVPVVATVGIKSDGAGRLRELLDDPLAWQRGPGRVMLPSAEPTHGTQADHETVHAILKRLGLAAVVPHTASDRIDRVVLHPVFGPLLLAVLLFLVFQAVFLWAQAPMDAIKSATEALGATVTSVLPEGWFRSLMVDGVIA
ncbi:MAG: FeoB small GTPase domain-containing protein, partial [Pseudomonadota bacterium]|nr:FeoB small GTPase domain-containing protein [Pseudomonadota bacterium]